MTSTKIVGSAEAVALYHKLKTGPHEKMLAEGHAVMVRLSEERVLAEKRHVAERAARLDPVHRELAAVVRKTPELSGAVRAIDALAKQPHRPGKLKAPARHRFAPQFPMARQGSIHIVDALPFFADTWTWTDGPCQFDEPLTADGTSGDMSFQMEAGTDSSGDAGSGHMACFAALGAQVAIPASPCVIAFTANPSVNWWYSEGSTIWRQAKGNMWAGLYVGLFNSDGSFLWTAVDSQTSVASFDHTSFADWKSDSGSNSAMALSGVAMLGLPVNATSLAGFAALGGFLQYWCWIGGSCNADMGNSESFAIVQMSANCSNLIVDIFEL